MKESKVFIILLLAALFLVSCSTYEAQFRDPDLDPVYPSEKTVERTFYLIGDAGLSPIDGMSDALIAFQNLIKEENTENDFAVFLGDNIYPDGMPIEGSPVRPFAENHINAQVNAVKEFKGETIFIPGNHDWYNGGLSGLLREENYLKKISDKDLLKPSGGCPLESIEVSENIQLIVVDTQWYLEDWNKDPAFNEYCEIKSREKLFIEIEVELQKYQDKTIVFAMHHPMFSNGTHGGYYALKKHLYPLQKKIPMPVLASLVAQIRSQGGVSVQDRYNELYNRLMNRLAVLVQNNDRLVFASGHEHTMHHIEKDGLIQIQTGNGAKSSFATIGEFGDFSYGGQGFAVMDVFEDGSSWVRYYGVGPEFQPNLLFQKEILPPRKQYDVTKLSFIPYSERTKSAAIYTPDSIRETLYFKTIWGAKYKDVYATPVTANIGRLDSIFGGVRVIGESRSENYKSLRLRDDQGNEYRMRALKKNALDYQTKLEAPANAKEVNPTQNNEIIEEVSIPETFGSNFYTASHPYAIMAVPDLAEAIDIFYTTPRLFYVPKQKRLGNYNEDFGDALYYISIEPNQESEGLSTFEYPDDVETTDDILIKLRRRGDITVDEANYIKSRLFDMLIGDWDRESDHWRWAEYFNRDSLNVYAPIPKNRDDAFSNFEGNILDVATSIFGSNNQRHLYTEDIRDIEFFNKEGIILDRALIKEAGRGQWLYLAREIQRRLNDVVIDSAFTKVPETVRDESLQEIITTLKQRRENLVDIADRYYTYLAKQQTIEGSNFNDYFEITRLPDGQTNVKVYPNFKAKLSTPLIDRTFRAIDTDEIWIFGLDGQDTFEIKGEGTHPIYVRIVGGQGKDTFKLINGRNAKVYDHESRENIVEIHNSGSLRFTDVYDLNTYDYRKQINRVNGYAASLGYNPDDGVIPGFQYTYRVNSYQRNPFSQRHVARGSYYFDTSSFDVEYSGEFANIKNDLNLSFGAYFTSPNYTENYFGYGNETKNPEETLGFDFNRVEIQTVSANAGLLRNSNFGSFYKVQVKFDAVTVGTPLRSMINPAASVVENETDYFGTVEGIYNYRSFDNARNPSRGMMFDLNLGLTDNLKDTDRIFGFLNTRLGFYNSLIKNRKLVLKTNVRGQFNFENKFEFYQGVKLGADTGLRGFRNERFTGKSSLVGSADLRFSFDEFKIELIPVQLGLYVGGDVGKVWVPTFASNKWHSDVGGGLWVNGSGDLQGTFSAFHSSEGTRYSFGFGFSF
jgi:hypothetical protein